MTESKGRNKAMLLLIFLAFSAPVIISWLILSFTGISEKTGGNHGQLVDPPRPMPDMFLKDPLNPQLENALHGKWSLVYLHEGKCLEVCVGNLYKMRQVRLATGKHAPRMQRVLVQFGPEEEPLNTGQLEPFAGQLLLQADQTEGFPGREIFRLQEGEATMEKRRIYLVDPLGNLMLFYPEDAEPKGMIKDLKRLLRYSRIG